MSKKLPKDFAKKLTAWYEEHKRDLPWRATNDAYCVWLSEIILQQTRVNQGMPYYLRFVEKYPTVADLANAPEQEVLRLWQGLGYYSRARNLHRCAKVVVSEYGGKFPSTFEGLKKLPGIGDYTAAAIASISFKEPVVVVDGNVYRVLARMFGIETPINNLKAKKEFFDLGNSLLLKEAPDTFNQALMEFGALYCTPQNPDCNNCIFSKQCVAKAEGLQKILPVKEKKLKVRKRYFYYVVHQYKNTFAFKKREQKDIWYGLYDFELLEKDKPYTEEEINKELKLKKVLWSAVYKHVLTHQIIYAQFLLLKSETKNKALEYFSLEKVGELPKPVLISKFLEDNGFLK